MDAQARNHGAEVPAYKNKLPVFKRLLQEQPEHALLTECLADAPTTTMQARSSSSCLPLNCCTLSLLPHCR